MYTYEPKQSCSDTIFLTSHSSMAIFFFWEGRSVIKKKLFYPKFSVFYIEVLIFQETMNILFMGKIFFLGVGAGGGESPNI